MSRVAHHRFLAAAAATTTLLMGLPAVAGAADEILLTLPVSGVHRGAEGTSVQVASANVPAGLVGQSCEIFGSTTNQRSVHPGNDLVIVNGDESFTIPNFEDEGNIVHDAGDVETLAATIQVSIVFGPDGASSGGFQVTLRNCTDVVETTVPPVETTLPDSTTEAPATTTESTTAPETTVVDEEDISGPTATPAPPNPAGPVAEPSTTEAPTTTAAPTTTEIAAAPTPLGPTAATDTLPVTGTESTLIAGFGALVLAAGLAIRSYASRIASNN